MTPAGLLSLASAVAASSAEAARKRGEPGVTADTAAAARLLVLEAFAAAEERGEAWGAGHLKCAAETAWCLLARGKHVQ